MSSTGMNGNGGSYYSSSHPPPPPQEPSHSSAPAAATMGCCRECSRAVEKEWTKLQVAQRKLSLQQERLTLDQEMLKAERKNLKRSSKLAKGKPSTVAEATTTPSAPPLDHMSLSPALVQELQLQLATAQAQLQERNDELALLIKTQQQENAATNTSSEQQQEQRQQQHEEEMSHLQERLDATQRLLASMLVEKDSMRRQRDALQEKVTALSTSSSAVVTPTSPTATMTTQLEAQISSATISSSIVCTKCADQQVEMQNLMDEIQLLKLSASSTATTEQQQQEEWQDRLETMQESHKTQILSMQDTIETLKQEKEQLQAEMQLLREDAELATLSAIVDVDLAADAANHSGRMAVDESDHDLQNKWRMEKQQLEQQQLEQQLADQALLIKEYENRQRMIVSQNQPNEERLQESIKQNEMLQQQLDTLQAQMDDQQELVQELQATKVALVNQQQQLQQQIQQLQQQLAEAKQDDPMTNHDETAAALQKEMEHWKEQKESMEKKLTEQARQLEDLNLLVPRNKALLEQATTKNITLQNKLDALRMEYNDQKELIKELQATKEALVKQQQEQKQHQKLEPKNTVTSNDQGTENMVDVDMGAKSRDVGPSEGVTIETSGIMIPFDLDHTVGEKKHVVEWEWTSKTGLYGMYTGWLDLTGTPCGHGTLRIEDGSIYDGEWLNGLRHGTL